MASLKPRRVVNGIVANSDGVQAWLDAFAEHASEAASSVLESESETHGLTGKSHIEWSIAEGKYGHVDREVALVDETNGTEGAMSIEYGRTGARGRGGPSRGIFPLHKGVMGAQGRRR